jgi:uncharacterized protein (DUF1697 family)
LAAVASQGFRLTRYVAFLRAISNVEMAPFRRALEELGLADVASYGMSGNLLFTDASADRVALERRITARLRTPAFVRTGPDLARVVAQDPFRAAILFLARAPTAARRQALRRLTFDRAQPVLRGTTVFFRYPARLRGRRAPFDFEAALDVAGTARSARVVQRVLRSLTSTGSGR